jgi:LuxR family maltose regulon positive regulatory protein
MSTGSAAKSSARSVRRTLTASVTGPGARPRSGATAQFAATVTRRTFGPPPFRDGFVPRPRLVARLGDAHLEPLAVIVAPPGYGKSTLLGEWAACDGRPFVWITLSRGDRHAADIATAIADAVRELGWIAPEDWPSAEHTAAGRKVSPLRPVLQMLAREQRTFVLVLDDAHAAAPAALRGLVSDALAQIGPGSQIAVASRTEPALPMGRLRAHRMLVEVRTEDLAMAPAEAAALLRLAGLELDFGAVQLLCRRTEGWPAGLYLAALSIGREEDVAGALERFGGDDRLASEYFRDEFLDGLSPALKGFVVRSSVLDELSGPLCDAVLRQSGSAATLAKLARGHLMLVALDQRDERFRWHGLFRETLRAELRHAEPELEPTLRARASSWLSLHGDLDGAIGHAVAAGDVELVGDLLWANVTGYLARGRHELLGRWLAGFTTEQIASHAPLALVAAHTRVMVGQIEEARDWALLAVEADRQASADAVTPSLQTGVAVIAAVAAESGPQQMAQDACRAYELEPEHSRWRPFCCLLAGTAEHLAGHSERARRKLEEGAAHAGAGAPGTAALCQAQLAIMAIERHDWTAAGELADRAVSLVEHPTLAAAPISALVFATSAATCARQGRIDESKRDLRHAANLLAAFGDAIPWYATQTRIMLAQAALGLADAVQARTLLAEASRLARRIPNVVVFQRSFDRAWAEIDTRAESALAGPSSLTIAELRVLRFLPSHRSFREIAERLDVSVNTVKTQAHAIYRKLDAASRSEAVARASRAGLLGT